MKIHRVVYTRGGMALSADASKMPLKYMNSRILFNTVESPGPHDSARRKVAVRLAERGDDDRLHGPSLNVAAWLDGPRRGRVGHIFLVSNVHVLVDRVKIGTQELLQAVAAGKAHHDRVISAFQNAQ